MRYIFIDIDDTLVKTNEVLTDLYKMLYNREPPKDYKERQRDPRFMGLIDDGFFMSIGRFNMSLVNVIRDYHRRDGFKVVLISHRGYHREANNHTYFMRVQLNKLLQTYYHCNIMGSNDVLMDTILLDPNIEDERNKLEWISRYYGDHDWVLVDDNPCFNEEPNTEFIDNLILINNDYNDLNYEDRSLDEFRNWIIDNRMDLDTSYATLNTLIKSRFDRQHWKSLDIGIEYE